MLPKISKFSLELVADNTVFPEEDVPATTENIVKLARQYYQGKDREIGLVVGIDANGYIDTISITGVGSLISCPFSTREVFKPLIINQCPTGVIIHNHPIGVARPSKGDVATYRLAKVVENLLDITIADSIIISRTGYYSFAVNGIPALEDCNE